MTPIQAQLNVLLRQTHLRQRARKTEPVNKAEMDYLLPQIHGT
jgi:hypothetical protein